MDTIIIIATSIAGALITFLFNTRLGLGPVKSSAWLTLLIAAYFHYCPDVLSPYLTRHIPVAYIGGSFIGMVSAQQLSTYTGIALAGLIFSFIYLNTSKLFTGYGGALGTSACISLLVVLSIPYFRTKRKMTIGLLQLRRLIIKKPAHKKRPG
ncbi:MAG: hypothetical protein BGO09_10490 [Bacteroidetes bacterium 47-18]|nr:MAG: hypothetical protein BGO09_10490 [Bacteroidetes bacterium 47-18]